MVWANFLVWTFKNQTVSSSAFLSQKFKFRRGILCEGPLNEASSARGLPISSSLFSCVHHQIIGWLSVTIFL